MNRIQEILVVLSISLALSFGVIACVVPSDLHGLADDLEAYQASTAQTLGDLADETITTDEAEEAVEESGEELLADIEQRFRDIEARTEALVDAIPTSTDDLVKLGGTALATFLAQNGYRNHKRRKREEPV